VGAAIQLLENLSLVAGGGVVTVLAQTISDRRRRREIERDAQAQKVEEELERLRNDVRVAQDTVAALRGYVEGKESR